MTAAKHPCLAAWCRFKFAVLKDGDLFHFRYRRVLTKPKINNNYSHSESCGCCFATCVTADKHPCLVPVGHGKFAVPIVADMLNKRYRRLQYDNTDSEFGNLEKPNIKEIHCFRAVDFSLSKNRLIKQYNGMFRQHCLKQFPYRQGINNFVTLSMQLH